MTSFLGAAPTLDANWRAVILFGRNVASYKFALAKTLLDFADRPDERIPLLELAAPFAGHLCEHLRLVDRQTTSSSSTFLEACRSHNRGELAQDKLVETTARLGFNNVLDAFHTVGTAPVPVRFFIDERKSSRDGGAIRLTDALRDLATSLQGAALSEEAEARWRLVENAWALDLPRAGLAVQADAETNMLYVERIRRVNLTGVRAALNGYQRGCCFYCSAEMPLAEAEVDHFFPWALKAARVMPDADSVWNLVLACRACNRGEQGKFARVPGPQLVARLNARNNWLVESHHPLRETIMLQTGQATEQRASFLDSRQQLALSHLIHQWHPVGWSGSGIP